ncbi:hypothetical protein FGG08_003731 [Glutinoglossum americanum]|uniref:GED domain-containing protein n=1 Tax=Glutinoglossum americanum TaxID=1670608 RepID=A0A9P8I930_9PEZI|nr:hypothetical protein FGG08_003731 [Glutinoglossum americanum]
MASDKSRPAIPVKSQPATNGGQNVPLSADPFQGRDDQGTLDMIDQLIECGINKSIGIPQAKTINVSIFEDPPARAVGLDAFARTLPSLTSAEFEKLIKEASTLLGVAQPGEPGFGKSSSKNFSSSTLKIEITGPGRTPFTIVDLPGLFHASTNLQKRSEIAEIKSMVNSYITDPGTIIVGVMHGFSNVATQEIFEMARETDPHGLRTVGVITKCDIVSDTTEILKLTRGEIFPLRKHGWFVVRNRGPKELGEVGGFFISNEERHSLETSLFSGSPWTQIPGTRRGVHALRGSLSSLLLKHSRSKLPGIEKEVNLLISQAALELKELGESRDGADAQRQFLQEIARQFQSAAEDALSGHYSSNPVLKDNELKLRKRISEANGVFSSKMLTSGHAVEFKNVESLLEKLRKRNLANSPATQKPTGRSIPEGAGAPFIEIDGWIREEIADNRGTELPGTPNPEVVPALFRRQTREWASHAQQHFEAIQAIIQEGTRSLLSVTCKGDNVRQSLEAELFAFNNEAVKAGEKEIVALVQDLREKPLQTNNPQFGLRIKSARQLRFENGLVQYLEASGQLASIHGDPAHLNPQLLFEALHISNSGNLADEIHDNLKAYYDLEVMNFVEFVVKHIVERYVASPIGGLKAFSPSWVGTLSAEELERLASESEETLVKRKEINDLLARLRKARSILTDRRTVH